MSKPPLSLNRLLYLFIAAGFLLLLAETVVHHQEVIHETPIPWIPIIFSGIGFLLCLIIGAVWRPGWVRVGQVFMVLAILVGLAGVFFHNEERFEEEEQNQAVATEAHEHEHGEEGEGGTWLEALHEGPPPLAPLAFAGMGMLGLLASARKWPGETADRDS